MSRVASTLIPCLLGSITGANAVTQLYGSGDKSGLVKIESSTGRLVPESPDMPAELQGQELSTIDKKRQIYYVVGFNATTDQTNLLGWDLNSHKLTVDVVLPLVESVFVGVGQAVDADPVTGDVFVTGRSNKVAPNSTTHTVARFHASTNFTTSEHIASIHGIDILDGSSTYDHKLGIEYLATVAGGSPTHPSFDIFAVDVATKKVTTVKTDLTEGKFVQDLDYDTHTGRIYGFGSDTKTNSRSLMYLEAKADKFVEVADVPKEFYMMEGNLVALDEEARVFYALITEGHPNTTTWKQSNKCVNCTGSPASCCYDPAQGPSSYTCFAVSDCSKISDNPGPDLSAPFHLFGMHIDTGKLVSKSPPVCALKPNATTPACPWTIESAQ